MLFIIDLWRVELHVAVVVGRSRTIAPSHGDLTLGGVDLEEVKSLRILGVTLPSKLTFETHLRKVVSEAANPDNKQR